MVGQQQEQPTTGHPMSNSLTLMAAEAEVALADRSARGKLSYDDFVAWIFQPRVFDRQQQWHKL